MSADAIIEGILGREGGYVNHPADRGGATNWGITRRRWEEYIGHGVSLDAMKAITREQAERFYKLEYIIAPNFDKIHDELLKELVVDCGVNHGVHRAAKWLQLAAGVKADGIVGPRTTAAVNCSDPRKLVLQIVSKRVKLYGRLVSRDHSQAVFAAGWNKRAAEFLDELVRAMTWDGIQ